MELKVLWIPVLIFLLSGLNCTFMELKARTLRVTAQNGSGLNCTFMELKELLQKRFWRKKKP